MIEKIKAFLSSCKMNINEDFLNNFSDFEKFLFLHKQLTLVSGKTPTTYDIEEYKEKILNIFIIKNNLIKFIIFG